MVDAYLEMLMNSVHSVQTQRQYTRTFVMFLKFTGLKNGLDVIQLEPKRLTELIIEYVLHLKNAISPIMQAANPKRTAVNATEEISFAIIDPKEKEPAINIEKQSIAA